jgi:hypothetical protein
VPSPSFSHETSIVQRAAAIHAAIPNLLNKITFLILVMINFHFFAVKVKALNHPISHPFEGFLYQA